MRIIRAASISIASLIGTAIRDGREWGRIRARITIAEASAVSAGEYERGRDREEVLLGLVGTGICLATVLLIAALAVENWVAVLQSVGMFFVLIPFCALASPLAFADFDARFLIEDGWRTRA